MAIDNAEKRRSAAGVPFLPLGPGVTPNSSKDAEWRQQAGWGYSGISVTAVVIPAVIAAHTAYVHAESRLAYVEPEPRLAYVRPEPKRGKGR